MDTTSRSDSASRVRRVQVGLQVWTVYEHTPSYDRRGEPTLVFESAEVVRRVRDFPRDWYQLGDAELAAIAENH